VLIQANDRVICYTVKSCVMMPSFLFSARFCGNRVQSFCHPSACSCFYNCIFSEAVSEFISRVAAPIYFLYTFHSFLSLTFLPPLLFLFSSLLADGSIRVIDQFNGDKLLIKAAHTGRVTSLQLHPSSLPTAATAAALGAKRGPVQTRHEDITNTISSHGSKSKSFCFQPQNVNIMQV
jgi:hypothetical protein